MTSIRSCLGLCLSVSLLTAADATEKVWFGASGDWTNAANWIPNGVPVATDAVLISDGVVNVTTDVGIGSLGLHGGTLASSGVLTVSNLDFTAGSINLTNTVTGTMNWTAGTLGASAVVTIVTNAALNLSGAADKVIYGLLTNAGTVTWAGSGNLTLNTWGGGPSEIRNLAGAMFDIQNDQLVWNNGDYRGSFYNDGLVRKSAGSGTNNLYVVFNNTGTVDVQSGALSLNGGGTGTGLFNNPAGSAILITAGYTFGPSSAISGAGANVWTGGTIMVNGAMSLQDLKLAGGVSGSGLLTVSNLDFTAGGINLTNTITGTMNWTAGGLNGAGVLTIVTDAVLNLSGAADKGLYGVLTNAGAVTWVGSGTLTLNTWGGPSVIRNLAGATFDIQNDQLVWTTGDYPGSFYNDGLVRKSAGSGTNNLYVVFNNTGTVDVQSGALGLNGGGTGTGLFNNPAGSAILITAGYTFGPGSAISGAGANVWTGGTIMVNGAMSLQGLELGGAGVSGSGLLTVSNLDFTAGGINLTNTITGTMNWTAGGLNGAGVLTIATNAALNLSGAPDKVIYGLLTNAGAVTWAGSGNLILVTWGGGPSVIRNLAGATFDIQNDQAVWSSGDYRGSFYNDGLVRKSAGSGTNNVEMIFNNTGTVEVQTGTLSLSGGITEASSATLSFGLRSVTDFGQITVPGAVNFTGRVCATLLDGYVPPTNSTFAVMTFASRTGDFTDTSCLTPSQGTQFQHEFTPTNLVLRAVSVATNTPGTADVRSCVVGKGQIFEQTDSAAPELEVGTPFEWRSFVYPAATNSVLAATWQSPLGETGPMSWRPLLQAFSGQAGAATLAELDTRFPIGLYTATITAAHEGLRTVSLNLPAGVYPNAPQVENWAAAQSLDATLDFSVAWNEFAGGTTNDFMWLYLTDTNGNLAFSTPATPHQPGALDGTSRAVVIPAATFPPQQSFNGFLIFYRVVAVDTNAFPGALCVALYYSATRFGIQTAPTTPTNAAPTIFGEPGSQTVPVGANVTFCVGATGTPPPAYQWRKNGEPRADATSSCFGIGSVTASDAGDYDVVVTNIAGSVTSTVATLTVLAPTPTNYAWMTLAGQPGSAEQFTFPFGVAVDSATNVYVSDREGKRICKILPDGTVTTLAGLKGVVGNVDGMGTAARFSSPHGVAVDTAGNVYVADLDNRTIRKITADGNVSTMTNASGVPARFAAPIGVAVDRQGAVYVAEETGQTIRKLATNGVVSLLAGTPDQRGSADGPGSTASFTDPHNLGVDLAGNVFVTDYGDYTIRMITPAAMVSTVAGLAGIGGSADGPANQARFYFPRGVAADRWGNLFIGDHGNCTIRKITPDGMVTTIGGLAGHAGTADGTGSAARFDLPASIAVSSAGVLYVADQGNGLVRRGQPLFGSPSQPLQLHLPVRSGTSIILSWDAASGMSLQMTTNLCCSGWQEVPGSRTTNYLSLPLTGPAAFFRLKGD